MRQFSFYEIDNNLIFEVERTEDLARSILTAISLNDISAVRTVDGELEYVNQLLATKGIPGLDKKETLWARKHWSDTPSHILEEQYKGKDVKMAMLPASDSFNYKELNKTQNLLNKLKDIESPSQIDWIANKMIKFATWQIKLANNLRDYSKHNGS